MPQRIRAAVLNSAPGRLDIEELTGWAHRQTRRDAAVRRMSAAGYLECGIVLDNQRDPVISRSLDELLAEAEFVIEPVTGQHARLARQAYADFGRGSGHRARLNFGDCLAYALALDTREPLLWKGDDFGHTGIASALGRYVRRRIGGGAVGAVRVRYRGRPRSDKALSHPSPVAIETRKIPLLPRRRD